MCWDNYRFFGRLRWEDLKPRFRGGLKDVLYGSLKSDSTAHVKSFREFRAFFEGIQKNFDRQNSLKCFAEDLTTQGPIRNFPTMVRTQ